MEVLDQLKTVETIWASRDKNSFYRLRSKYRALSSGFKVKYGGASVTKAMTVYREDSVIKEIDEGSITFRMRVDDESS